MNGQAQMGSEGVDLNFVLLDLTTDVVKEFKEFLKNFDAPLTRTWIIFTKADLVDKEKLDMTATFATLKEINPAVERHFAISTKDGHNIHLLTGAIQDSAQSAPHLYPDGDVSNKNTRFFVTEYIREQAFRLLKEELPYEIAVIVEEYKDLKTDQEAIPEALISASI